MTATNTAAAAVLRSILERLPRTNTSRDTREREAMAAAAGVLEHDRPPLPAVERVYRRHG
jgi:hypothetical protein